MPTYVSHAYSTVQNLLVFNTDSSLLRLNYSVFTHADGCRVSIAIGCVCGFVCDSVCLYDDKTKLGTGIVYHDTNIRSKSQRSRIGL